MPQKTITFPDLDKINLNDVEVQKELIRSGVAVGMPGGPMVFTESVRIVAGKNEDGQDG